MRTTNGQQRGARPVRKNAATHARTAAAASGTMPGGEMVGYADESGMPRGEMASAPAGGPGSMPRGDMIGTSSGGTMPRGEMRPAAQARRH